MFGAEEEDADFLSPSGGAKLASLFGLDQMVSGQENESFQYTAPKQPKKGQAVVDKTSKVTAVGSQQVLFATAVHAYRFVGSQYVKQGKFGVAVLANHVTREYRVLLYVSQQQPVTAAKIHPEFAFTVQPNNYSNFYDDQRQNWSVMFESEKAACDFNKQICIAKWNSRSSLDCVLYQELVLGEGQAVEVGDSMEVAYTGWLFQNNGLGQVFDANINKDKLLRLKLGSGKVIKGWEEGMVGLKKGGKRLLIIPPALAYGSQGVTNRIPPNSTLVFEVEVKRVKLKDVGSDRQSIDSRDSAAPSPVSSTDGFSAEPPMFPPSSVPPKPGEPAVRAKSNSISEQLANPDVAKAKLISRMAKMGQPMLPFLAGTPALQPDSSDSELEDPGIVRDSAHPVAPPPIRRTPQLSHAIPPQLTMQVPGLQPTSAALLPVATVQTQPTVLGNTQSFQPYTGMTYAYSSGPAPSSQLQALGQMYPASISQPPHFQASGDVTSFLMTEARQHNTEIRMAFSKVADKIDRLASKVDELQKQNTSNSLLPGLSSVTMETAMIMNNIQRIIQENERLKQEVFEKSSRIEEQNEKISALIQRNQRYVEQSNLLMEQRNDSLKNTTESTQARVLHAEQEKAKVAEELTAATGQISHLQLELAAHQKKEMAMRSQLTTALQEAEKQGQQLSMLQAQLIELQEKSEHDQSRLKAEKQSRKQFEVKVASLEEEVTDLMAEKKILEKSLAERKKKSQLEQQQAEEEMEEIRKSYQAELDKLRQGLIKARTSTDQAAAEQLSLVQAEVESQWQAKCDRLLSSAREQHLHQYQEVCEQKEVLEHRLTQLQEKLQTLKQSRETEDQKLAALQEQTEQLEPLKEKYSALQSHIVTLKESYEEQVHELEKKISLAEQKAQSPDTIEEIKRIMNSVFQHLRGEFELEEVYSGRVVLSVIMNTIKTVTLQLLSRQAEQETQESSSEEEEEETKGNAVGECTEVILQKITSKLDEKLQDATNSTQVQSSEHQREVEDPELSSTACEEVNTLPKAQEEQESSNVQEEESTIVKTVLPISQETLKSSMQLFAADKEPEVLEDTLLKETLNIEHSEAPIENVTVQKEENPAPVIEVVIVEGITRESTVAKTGVTETLMGNEEDQEGSKEKALEEPGTPLQLGSKEDAESCGNAREPVSERDTSLPAVTTLDMADVNVNKDGSSSEPKEGQNSVHRSNNSSVYEDESDSEDLFKMAPAKPLKLEAASRQEEEEEEEEESMKGRPPPAPLFGDDDDDDDLDWLG